MMQKFEKKAWNGWDDEGKTARLARIYEKLTPEGRAAVRKDVWNRIMGQEGGYLAITDKDSARIEALKMSEQKEVFAFAMERARRDELERSRFFRKQTPMAEKKQHESITV